MDLSILVFVLVGFLAQMIDGALGMAYGVSSNTFLLSIGIPPAAASASVHMAEVVTTGISGFSHWRLENIDKELIKRLIIPGVIGGVVGAYLLTEVPADIIKPIVAAYLLIMGVVILFKAIRVGEILKGIPVYVTLLGLVGGFFDAIGGGGWGPIVTTTLIARGTSPRFTIGSVNFSEFFVTFAESVTFILALRLAFFAEFWTIILGLLIGGAIAAPLAAVVTKKLPTRALMAMVGVLIIILSIRTIYMAFA
ncbi:MAG: hypothetical protein A2Z16_10225 [Chloroflexi bacterium RBG_16_54_18]|nr:MAG: hypothetical protein A2Z16_10225 [Chloroflexi bacterium RBG_16_54_18]